MMTGDHLRSWLCTASSGRRRSLLAHWREPTLVRWVVVVACCLSQVGCSRSFWRSQADFDSYNQVLEKVGDERWTLPRIAVDADPRSRFYDPYDLDRAPLPPDDAAANEFMHNVDGMLGYQGWHKFGQLMSVENPQWMAAFSMEPEELPAMWDPSTQDQPEIRTTDREVPTIRNLTLEQAIELSNIHSRDYQRAIEDVYLSALSLTFEQFQFNVRYLGLTGSEPTASTFYENIPGETDRLRGVARFGISQLLPSGGQIAAELANNTLWLFSGPGATNSASLLSFSLVQPLLLGAGRKVVLEGLTQSERDLLYAVRDLAHFRRVFFGQVVVNGTGGGYLGLLRQSQIIENQRDNIQSLAIQVDRLYAVNGQDPFEVVEQLPAGFVIPDDLIAKLEYDANRQRLYWRGNMTLEERDRLVNMTDDPAFKRTIENLASRVRAGTITLDLAQLLTRLSGQQNTLRDAERRLADLTDQFKLDLGLPTDFQLTIDQSLRAPFQLIDDRLNEVELQVLRYTDYTAELDLAEPNADGLRRAAERLKDLLALVRVEGIDLVRSDFERVAAFLPTRLQRLPSEANRDRVLRNLERDRTQFRDTEEVYNRLAQRGTSLYEQAFEEGLDLDTRRILVGNLRRVREELLQNTQSLKVLQVGLRSELIELQPFDMSIDEVVETALMNRLELMNARARVMDTRRQMEIAANNMLAAVDVVVRADVGTSGGARALDFRGENSLYQAGLRFTAPLDQVLERNAYRATQIEYQRARRDYMLLEDRVKLDVRTAWRQLNMLVQNFETARQNLRYAAMQLDSAIINSDRPIPAGQTQVGGNQGLNLQNALQSVLNAQNDLIGTWIQYEQNRINIHRDMDTMVVDDQGMWSDPFYQSLKLHSPSSLPQSPTETRSLNEPADESGLPPAPGVTLRRRQQSGPAILQREAAGTGAAQIQVVDDPGRTGDRGATGRVVLADGPGRLLERARR